MTIPAVTVALRDEIVALLMNHGPLKAPQIATELNGRYTTTEVYSALLDLSVGRLIQVGKTYHLPE
jgi:hypothetical protein